MEFTIGKTGKVSDKIFLSEDEFIKFTENTKGESPKFSIIYTKTKEYSGFSLGSVPENAVDMVVKSIKNIYHISTSTIEFINLVRNQFNTSKYHLIVGLNENEFYEILDFYNENLN